MSANILNFVKKLLPSLNKTEIESDMETSMEVLYDLMPSVEMLGEMIDEAGIASPQNKKLVAEFYKQYKPSKGNPDIAGLSLSDGLAMLLERVSTNGKFILDEIGDNINDVVVSKGLTSYKAYLVRATSHYYFMGKYLGDLINYVYTHEASARGYSVSKSFALNKKQEEAVVDNLWLFVRLIAIYGMDNKVYVNGVKAIEDVYLPDEKLEKELSVSDYAKMDNISTLPNGFIGSPIYSIRLAFATWEAERYKYLKDKKKLLELRALHLKMLKETGSGDLSVEKEIEYLQKRITDTDYKLAKMEEDIA